MYVPPLSSVTPKTLRKPPSGTLRLGVLSIPMVPNRLIRSTPSFNGDDSGERSYLGHIRI